MTNPVIGFCGTGLLGAPIARRLLKAGHKVHVWNRSREKAQALAADGATVQESPAALASQCQVIFLCLTDDAAVEATVFGDSGLATHPGATIVDHSSLSPWATREFARRWQELSGHGWVDAPVSGGVRGAEAGTLAIMAGGAADDVERVSPLMMQTYAARVTHMGPAGAGQAAKLCNQTIVASTVTAIAEAVALAHDSGIDAGKLHQALAGGWADSTLLQLFVPRMTTPVNDKLGTVHTMGKDVENVARLADATGTRMAVLRAVRDTFSRAREQGLADEDLSAIVQVPWPSQPADIVAGNAPDATGKASS